MLSMAHGPKVGSGAGQSSAWAKALTNGVMVLTSTWGAMSCNEGQISTTMQKKGTIEKGDQMPRTYPEKLIKRSESMTDMLSHDDCFRVLVFDRFLHPNKRSC